ncbi:hypothetical protein FRC03_009670 [Tulasnella sp. 419]|nr:hypothetical protein FRC03_009670 [Tulasnella sp. 419]
MKKLTLPDFFTIELSYHIRLSSIPFPPVLIGRSVAGSLIAQTYLSSHPASGLLLISPPTNTQSLSVSLPSDLKDFDYEPRFPLLILDHTSAKEKQEKENRLVRDWQVELISLENLDGQEAFRAIEGWLDESGF